VLRMGDRYRNQALALAGCGAIGLAAVAGSIVTAKATVEEPSASSPLSVLSPER